jgi:hypothetical protein
MVFRAVVIIALAARVARACAIPDHRYTYDPAVLAQGSAVADLGSAPVSWPASVGVAGRLVARGNSTDMLARGGGLTLRALCPGGWADVSWSGFSAAAAPGGVVFSNAYTGGAFAQQGQPPLPRGAYVTHVLSRSGAAAYAGRALWAASPLAALAPDQGSGAELSEVSPRGCASLDLQVFYRAMSAAEVESAAAC